jgi:hypothetical protein
MRGRKPERNAARSDMRPAMASDDEELAALYANSDRWLNQREARIEELKTALSEALELAEEMSPENEWAGGRRPPEFQARLDRLKAVLDGKEPLNVEGTDGQKGRRATGETA